jgi:hypothetical protein
LKELTMEDTERVVIGMDPHKRSVTIEVMAGNETVCGGGRFGTDADGYRQLVAYAKQWPGRVWAIEGCSGIGHHVAMRLRARRSSTCRRSSRRVPGSSRMVRDVRPTPPTRTRSRWSGPDGRAAAGGQQ